MEKKVDKKFKHIGLKDDILEASSPTCHMTKLLPAVELETCQNLLFLYSDGGPDHQLTYISVQLILISFILYATRAVPFH